ncbi:amidohydrolase family protein [Mycobacterium sp. KBS0706]|uniref:amidohydrolase family protein n=1 Tax=Mycobacterium sp. KBS0706 TaxID=2578109 RepID=UPI00110F9B92|nr:amidohydrolase family protein [Mycobacterium sp. KBS0706]TSD86625.1 amidohydrolase family protein [Mycobacterium sp. KBS0706]
MDDEALPILDCHQHFYDARHLRYPVFAQRSAGFEVLVGDYSALPRVYRPEDYGRDTAGLNVVKTIWAEFISDDPVGEVRWAGKLARATGRPNGMIGLVDFRSPDLERMLDTHVAAGPIRCVRQHLGWHPTDPRLRFAPGPDLLSDAAWRRGVASLRGRDLVCEIEVFGPQLFDLAAVAAACPDIQFVLPVMGWPLDLTNDGRSAWKRGIAAVAGRPNVALKIFGMECIFGIRWTVAQIRPWILDAIEAFGPRRCMFASHMPICRLSCTFRQLYGAYLEVIDGCSPAEKRQLMCDTAASVYTL